MMMMMMANSCLLRKSESKEKKYSTQNVPYFLAGRVSMIYCHMKNVN